MSQKKKNQKSSRDVSQEVEKQEKNKWGRPSKFTDDTVRKLEDAFRCAWSDTDACAYAGISRETFYDWMDENRRFSDNFTKEMQDKCCKGVSKNLM